MWSYSQTSGELKDSFGALIGTGYSGFNHGKNNPEAQSIHDVGPIPVGLWYIGAAYKDPEKGPVVMALTPDESTEKFGRSGFLIHGDSIQHPGQASHGCLILPHDIRVAVSLSPDKLLYVTA